MDLNAFFLSYLVIRISCFPPEFYTYSTEIMEYFVLITQ